MSESKPIPPLMVGGAVAVLVLLIALLYFQFSRAGKPNLETIDLPPNMRPGPRDMPQGSLPPAAVITPRRPTTAATPGVGPGVRN